MIPSASSAQKTAMRMLVWGGCGYEFAREAGREEGTENEGEAHTERDEEPEEEEEKEEEDEWMRSRRQTRPRMRMRMERTRALRLDSRFGGSAPKMVLLMLWKFVCIFSGTTPLAP